MSKQYIFGLHAVQALLEKHPERILRLFALQDRQDKKLDNVLRAARQLNMKVDYAARPELDRMAQEGNHPGVVALCTKLHTYSDNDLKPFLESLTEPAFLLILDGVQDPHNLGACFRSADAAGVHAIIAP